jgi:hypothetical protein
LAVPDQSRSYFSILRTLTHHFFLHSPLHNVLASRCSLKHRSLSKVPFPSMPRPNTCTVLSNSMFPAKPLPVPENFPTRWKTTGRAGGAGRACQFLFPTPSPLARHHLDSVLGDVTLPLGKLRNLFLPQNCIGSKGRVAGNVGNAFLTWSYEVPMR